MNIKTLRELLVKHEALRLKPYKDTVGKWTIGVGRNLTDNGIRREEAMLMLDNDIRDAVHTAMEVFSTFDDLNDVRQHVLIDMAFNMGFNRLSKFHLMIAALNENRPEDAADEMVDSKWYKQVGIRGVTLERMMRTGEA